jgi:hypothetical protein
MLTEKGIELLKETLRQVLSRWPDEFEPEERERLRLWLETGLSPDGVPIDLVEMSRSLGPLRLPTDRVGLVELRHHLRESLLTLDEMGGTLARLRRTIEPYLPSPEQAAEAPESLSPTPTATLPLIEILTLPDPPSPLQDLYHSALVRGGQTYLGTPPPEQSPKPNE